MNDVRQNIEEERACYKSGTPLDLRECRRRGTCRWGHPGYVQHLEDGTVIRGHNAAQRKSSSGREVDYCAACHRCQVDKTRGHGLER